MDEPKTRKALREQQERAEAAAKERDRKRVEVEREYSRTESKHQEKIQRFDEKTYRRISGLKQKLNWAIGIVVVLLVIVGLVMFFL